MRDLQFAFGFAGSTQNLRALLGPRFVDHFDARKIDAHRGFFVGGGDALAQGGRRILVEQTGQFHTGGGLRLLSLG